MDGFGFDTTLGLDIFGGSGDDYVATNNDVSQPEIDYTGHVDGNDYDAQEAMREEELARLANADPGADTDTDTDTDVPQKPFQTNTDTANKTNLGPNGGKDDGITTDKIMAYLEKNPRLLTAGLGLIGGGLAGMNQQKQFDDKMAFEQKNLDRQYEVRRQELDRAYEEKRKSLQPGKLYGAGTGRNEVWGGSGLLATAKG